MTTAEPGSQQRDTSITEHELEQCERANATGRQPAVFVHGLWLLPSSWDRWAKLFEDNGYAALTPGWPDDPDTVEQAKAHPEVFAGKSIGQVADHFEATIRTVPWAIANASFKQQQDNPGVTEIDKIPDRGHALTIDHGWREVADKALGFVKRFV